MTLFWSSNRLPGSWLRRRTVWLRKSVSFARFLPTLTLSLTPLISCVLPHSVVRFAGLVGAPAETVEVTKDELLSYLKLMYTMRRMEITCDTEYKVTGPSSSGEAAVARGRTGTRWTRARDQERIAPLLSWAPLRLA